jgi:hypothetical protein
MLHFTFVIGNLGRSREVAKSRSREVAKSRSRGEHAARDGSVKIFAAAAMSPPAHNRSAGYGVHD